jgi:hypothetical protein
VLILLKGVQHLREESPDSASDAGYDKRLGLFVSLYLNQTSHIPSAMPDDFDLESLVHLEQTFALT